MKKLLLSLTFLACMQAGFSQDKNFWTSIDQTTITRNLFEQRIKPTSYKIFNLNELSFLIDSRNIPSEKAVAVSQSTFIITVPNAQGTLEKFKVVEAPVMSPELSAKYPEIKSYAGQGIEDPSANIRFDMSPRGFHAVITSANRSTVYIDPIERSSSYYIVFSRKDVFDFKQHFNCGTDVNSNAAGSFDLPQLNRLGADDGKLRTYRLALACTGEYAQYFLNGTETSDAQRKAKVLAAMNTLLTRTNQVYERDFGTRMVLIGNNDAIIYLNGTTDPWTTEWNTKTQQTIDAVIGNTNYDIGHLVHKEATAANNNGNAGCIGCVCKTGSKGSAFTSHVNPEGDPFVVDYTTHEMGHQFGANHTYTFRNEGTTVQTEPGSGSTIMGYAGITGATTDVQPHSDDYFHSKSIEQVTNYIKGATGGGCAAVTTIGNTAPTVNAGADYTIPKSTPFIITGTASDVDAANVLQYNWEQIDNWATSGAATVPSATSTKGPQFRSYNYSASSSRTIPQLNYILSGANGYKWEVLPSVARPLNFRLTVRDNNSGGGNNNTDDILITVSAAGPFAVTAPNTALSWEAGTSQAVSWSVNSTNLAPVNCVNVKISLSTDGGQTFPTVLLASTPNDGTESITVPSSPSTTCRIKIEPEGNIFFDISNADFTISGTAACGNPAGLNTSSLTNTSATVNWTAVPNALSYDVDYKLNATSTWTNAATATAATSVNLTGLTQGSLYDWRVRANCSATNGSYTASQFTTTAPATCGDVIGLASSAVTSTSATLSWNAVSGSNNYDVDYKTNSSGTWVNAVSATTATSVNLSGLTASTLYDWRVRANCTGATGAYSAAQFTTIAAQTGCVSAFEANETLATAASIATNTPVSGAIGSATDIDYYKFTTAANSNLTITLSNLPGDYDLTLYNSAGTQIGNSAAGGTSNETISLTNQPAGTYYVKVFGYNGANSTTVCYSLTAGTSTVTGCQSSYDVSANGTTAGAATIPFNTNITGLMSPSADVDNYKFVITTGGTITVTLGTLPADYDLKLLNSGGSQVAISKKGGTTNESINYTAAPGTYYAQVYGYNGANNATLCYTLQVQLGTASKSGIEDDLITKASLNIYPNPASDVLILTLPGIINKNTMVTLIDAKGVTIREHRISNNIEKLKLSGLAKGMYLLRVNNGGVISTSKFLKQ